MLTLLVVLVASICAFICTSDCAMILVNYRFIISTSIRRPTSPMLGAYSVYAVSRTLLHEPFVLALIELAILPTGSLIEGLVIAKITEKYDAHVA